MTAVARHTAPPRDFKPRLIDPLSYETTMRAALLLLLSLASTTISTNADDPLLWGPYRSNLYFGLRPRIPQSLMTGLMWFGTQDYQSVTRELLVLY